MVKLIIIICFFSVPMDRHGTLCHMIEKRYRV